jgi:hypothetical protein
VERDLAEESRERETNERLPVDKQKRQRTDKYFGSQSKQFERGSGSCWTTLARNSINYSPRERENKCDRKCNLKVEAGNVRIGVETRLRTESRRKATNWLETNLKLCGKKMFEESNQAAAFPDRF